MICEVRFTLLRTAEVGGANQERNRNTENCPSMSILLKITAEKYLNKDYFFFGHYPSLWISSSKHNVSQIL
jgi:hypothetical protein